MPAMPWRPWARLVLGLLITNRSLFFKAFEQTIVHERNSIMVKVTLLYIRYTLTTLATVGFGITVN